MSEIRTFRAPGRVNLIGEHTDYNLGFVLPIALDLAAYVEVHRRDDSRLHLVSDHKPEERSWAIDQLAAAVPQNHWTDYVIGVAQQLIARNYTIQPGLLKIRSDVPEGSGLSSSAALEVSSALALLDGRDIDKVELAKLCQRAENVFVGMPSGIMDQYVSVFGRANSAIKIDCRSLEYEPVTLPAGVEVVVVNSKVKHDLGTTAYRDRVDECAMAVDAIQREHKEVQSLRDVAPEYLEQVKLPKVILRRARHVVSENQRVKLFVAAAARSDLKRMGALFVESHRSMRNDYEITCEEIDFLVDAAVGIPGCFGARMTGGGFGGSTVNLVAPAAVPAFETAIRKLYQERFAIDPPVLRVVAAEGAGEVATADPDRDGTSLAG